MKTMVAALLLVACTAQADPYQTLCSLIESLTAEKKEQANEAYKLLQVEDEVLARSISMKDFMMPCVHCSGSGEKKAHCTRCDGDGNSSAFSGSVMKCTRCQGSGKMKVPCPECEGAGDHLDTDAMHFLLKKLKAHYAETGSIYVAWELARTDLDRKRAVVMDAKTIRGKISQIADGGLFVTHSVNYDVIREFIVGAKTEGHYEGEYVEAMAWPIGTYTYTSVLGASVTVQKFSINLWGDW